MKDSWFYIISAAIFIVVLVFAKRPQEAKILALSLWIAVGGTFVVGIVLFAVAEGDYAKAGKALLLLLVILTITGTIPMWLIQAYQTIHSRKKKGPRSGPLKTSSNQAIEPTRLMPRDFARRVSAPRCVVIPKKPAVRSRARLIFCLRADSPEKGNCYP